MGKLYLSAFQYQPRLLATTPPSRETYAHDDGATYIVLQPFVLEPATSAPAPDEMPARDYLRTFSTADLAKGVQLVGKAEIGRIKAGTCRSCPVLFPPGTNIAFSLDAVTRNGAQVHFEDMRLLGGTSPPGPAGGWDQLDGSSTTGWPAFAALSSALPPVRSWAGLDAGTGKDIQKTLAMQGLLTLFSVFAAAWPDGNPQRRDERDLIFVEVVKPFLAKTPLDDTKAWFDYLQKRRPGGGTNASFAYDQLLPLARGQVKYSPEQPAVSLPTFQWTVHGVENRPDLFLAHGVTERSYIDALWAEMRGLAEQEHANGSPVDDLPVSEMLGRLFGFGERLAWPVAKVDGSIAASKRFMTLLPSLAGVPDLPGWITPSDWLATNTVSLAGQVLRLPFDSNDPYTSVSACQLKLSGTELEPPAQGSLREMIELGFVDIAAIPPLTPGQASAVFSGPAGEQPDPATHPDRIVYFAARRAPMPRLGKEHGPSSRILFAVPAALLDVLDATASFVDRGLDGRIVRNAARRALAKNEVLNAKESIEPAKDLWLRRSIELAPRSLTGSAGLAFAIRLTEDVHASETIVEDWVEALGTGKSAPPAWLWIPTSGGTKGGEIELLPALLERDADGALVVLDADPKAAGSLSELLGLDLDDPRPAPAELAFLTTGQSSGLFDILEYPVATASKPPELALAKAPLTRLTRSADRLAGALALSWPVEFNPEYDLQGLAQPDVRALHFAETNKLRMTLDLPAVGTRKLSEPDAQLPLPPVNDPPDRPWRKRGPISDQGPQAWYWFAEHFDHDTPLDDAAEEDTRFQLWNAPSAPLNLKAYVEHQYGHRVDVSLTQVQFTRSVDIAHLADLMALKIVEDRAEGDKNKRVAFLELAEIERDDNSGRDIKLLAKREALKLALEDYDLGKPGPLRALYRSLAEFRDALANGGARLIIESWVFENDALIGSGGAATLGSGMRPRADTPVPLKALAGTGLQALIDTLAGDFAGFVAACRNEAGLAEPDLAILYEAPSTTFNAKATMLRARLEIDRAAALRPDAAWAEGPFVPVADEGAEAGAALAATAKADLQDYLTDAGSRLAQAIAWAETTDVGAADAGMGPGASKFIIPDGATDPVERVADLFYLPHAFVLPEAHPWLGDRRATADFGAFCLQLVEDLLAGKSVADRLALPALTPAEALPRRRAIATILKAEPDGAAARMMRLFRRVDEPARNPGSGPRTKLHWHAGKVVESLDAELRSKGPTAAMRRKLLARPTLFISLRAVGLGVFNREISIAGPHPAPDINHSTFSTELAELRLAKKLIDDRDEVQTDNDLFPVSDMEGAAGRNPAVYFLDLLDEQSYDDLVEITPATFRGVDPLDETKFGVPHAIGDVEQRGGASAKRGEEALDPDTRAGLEANVVHVVPTWRVEELQDDGSKALRAFYLLPERVPPPRARAVEVRRKGEPCGRDEIIVELPDPLPGETLPKLSPEGQWKAKHDAIAATLGHVTILPTVGDPKSYRRIEPAVTSTGPAAYLPSVVAAGDRAKNWHLLTVYMSHFWFELDLQKPGESWSVNLEDDTYELEVEMWNGTPEPEEELIEPTPSNDALLSRFREMRAKADDVSQAAPAPPNVTWDDLEKSLDRWLASGQAGQTLFDYPTLLNRKKLRQGATLRKFRIQRPVGKGAWRFSEISNGKSPDSVGALVSFEVLARTDPKANKGPRYDDKVEDSRPSVLIRISILDTPARVSRARLRVVRNWKDVGGDGTPDIAADFFLAERYSAWRSEGREPLIVNEEDFKSARVPKEGREIQAQQPAAALTDWLAAIDRLDLNVDHGAALPITLRTKVFTNLDTRADETLWEEGWMETDDFSVGGTVLRETPDSAFLYGRADPPMEVAERALSLAGQLLPTYPASRIAELLEDLRPSRVRSANPTVHLVWRDKENKAVLELSLPLNLRP